MKIRTDFEISRKDFYKAVFEHSLSWQIEIGRHEEQEGMEKLKDFVDAVGYYNEFDCQRVKRMFEAIDQVIPTVYYNKDNPNNGKRAYYWKIGRESSPCIYIEQFGADSELKKTKGVIKDIEKLANEVGLVDEFDMEITGEGYYKQLSIRMWWD